MKFRIYRNTDLTVSEVGFGLWTISTGWWGNFTEGEAIALMHKAFDLGITLFDAADTYGNGLSEELIAKAFPNQRDEIVIATKVGYDFVHHGEARGRGQREIPQDFSPEAITRATDAALKRLGIADAKIAVSGLNPHAGEGGLFGREEIEIIKPAMDTVAAEGLNVAGPFGADTMFHMPGFDAFVVMLHDQGHIATKLLAQNAAAALTIGTPILFASVAHGTGHDIAGKGIASPAAMIEAVLRLSKASKSGNRAAA